jgi:hypothetical protein
MNIDAIMGGASSEYSLLAGQQWRPFRNDSREPVPPFGVVWIDGGGLRSDRTPYLSAKKPAWFGGQLVHWLNGPTEVLPGDFGSCTDSFPAFAAFTDDVALPQPGQLWGPIGGEWEIRDNVGGFRVCGRPIIDDGINRVLVIREPQMMLIGRTDEEISEDANGDVVVLRWQKSERNVVTLEEPSVEQEALYTIKAREVIGGVETIPADTRVVCTWNPELMIDEDCRGWMITAFAC